ncbi:hypothetical protein Pyn_34431 [Prunus yedoensis var. nudiflora]|uniref:Uncharacterized protein n=1 Tax=Prunus yedoensis var. nudiflora TaxID=2094558 RepID=A0A314Y4X1_PRUYE|nr:hypothetical protein Pyn_34431 [Prunus yedoensis var. nudiflora]
MTASDAPRKKELGILEEKSAQRQSLPTTANGFLRAGNDGVEFGLSSLPTAVEGRLPRSHPLSRSEFAGERKRKEEESGRERDLL